MGCLGIPLVTEISEVLACGSAWLRVPETIRVNLTGSLTPGVTMRDIAQRLIVDLGADLADYTVVEYGGPALSEVDFGGRMVLCNTPIEIGAKSALVETDEATERFLAPRMQGEVGQIASDQGAVFKAKFEYDLGTLGPQVAIPPTPDNVVEIAQVAGKDVHYAFIGSCAAASLTDLQDLPVHGDHPQEVAVSQPGTVVHLPLDHPDVAECHRGLTDALGHEARLRPDYLLEGVIHVDMVPGVIVGDLEHHEQGQHRQDVGGTITDLGPGAARADVHPADLAADSPGKYPTQGEHDEGRPMEDQEIDEGLVPVLENQLGPRRGRTLAQGQS